ncbi:uncharacterized protein LOC142628780 [Castanea sativa]|uniref:uncharacterized protein LOC142628780 n=1 Tax=Castanea sativa TaxID=21020 RepID=UPI003F652B53
MAHGNIIERTERCWVFGRGLRRRGTERVYVDGAANQKESGVGLVVISPEKIIIEKSLRLSFLVTNNEAEYEALLVGMDMVQNMGGTMVEMFSDSRLVLGQQILRSRNTHADSLATLATSLAQSLPRIILVEDLCKPTNSKWEKAQIHQVRAGPSWMDPIVLFLRDNVLPEGKVEADKMRRKAPRFWLFEDQKLYNHSFFGPYLLCIHLDTVEPLLEELHEGICGSHTRGGSLSHRALTRGYW